MQTQRWPTQADAPAPDGHALTGKTPPGAEHRPNTGAGAIGHRHARRHACDASCPGPTSSTWTLSRPAASARAEHRRCAPSPRAPYRSRAALAPRCSEAPACRATPAAAAGRAQGGAHRTHGRLARHAPARGGARLRSNCRRPALPAARRIGVGVGARRGVRVPAGATGPAAHGHARHGLACRAHTARRVRHHSVSGPGSL